MIQLQEYGEINFVLRTVSAPFNLFYIFIFVFSCRFIVHFQISRLAPHTRTVCTCSCCFLRCHSKSVIFSASKFHIFRKVSLRENFRRFCASTFSFFCHHTYDLVEMESGKGVFAAYPSDSYLRPPFHVILFQS